MIFQFGIYVFMFMLFCFLGGYFSFEFMVNVNVFDGIVCDVLGVDWFRIVFFIVVVYIN